MDSLRAQKNAEMEARRVELSRKKQELLDMEKKGGPTMNEAGGFDKIETELAKAEGILEKEQEEMARIMEQMEKLNNPMIRATENNDTLIQKKKDMDRMLQIQSKEDQAHQAIQKTYEAEIGKKEI